MKSNTAAFVLAIVVASAVCFWGGVLIANIIPGLHPEPAKMVIDTAVAVGTIGAVIVALWQIAIQREETQSRICLDEARRALELAVEGFLSKTDKEGRPVGERRHWLTFARGILIAHFFGERITNA